MRKVILLVAHGTVEKTEDLEPFLLEIRRGRPAPPELLAEMVERYDAIGGSPLLRLSRAQAQAVEEKTGIETRTAMRLWEPRVRDVLADLGPDDHVCLVPLAPFSVEVYQRAAAAELEQVDNAPRLSCVAPWGQQEDLIDAYVSTIEQTLAQLSSGEPVVVLTAHSLPMRVIQSGDQYEEQFRMTANLVAERLQVPTKICFQSQGAMAGQWLGPDLETTMVNVKNSGATHVVVAPIGFLAEHVETLYDLDREAFQQAKDLGLHFARVPALNSHPGLVGAIAQAVDSVFSP